MISRFLDDMYLRDGTYDGSWGLEVPSVLNFDAFLSTALVPKVIYPLHFSIVAKIRPGASIILPLRSTVLTVFFESTEESAI